jgi:hypothetical protein
MGPSPNCLVKPAPPAARRASALMRACCWLTAANWPLISIRPAGAPLRHTVVVLNRACTCADRPVMSANYVVDPAQMLGSRTPVLNCAVRR